MADPQKAPDRLPANFDFSKPITITAPDKLPANFDFEGASSRKETPEPPGFLESYLDSIKGIFTGVAHDLAPKSREEKIAAANHAVDVAAKYLHGDDAEKAAAKDEMIGALPLGGTYLKTREGNYAGAAGDLAALGTVGAAVHGIGKIPEMAASAPVTAVRGAVGGLVNAIPEAAMTSALKYTGMPQLVKGAVTGAKEALANRALGGLDPTLLEGIAQGQLGKAFSAATKAEQDLIRNLASRLDKPVVEESRGPLPAVREGTLPPEEPVTGGKTVADMMAEELAARNAAEPAPQVPFTSVPVAKPEGLAEPGGVRSPLRAPIRTPGQPAMMPPVETAPNAAPAPAPAPAVPISEQVAAEVKARPTSRVPANELLARSLWAHGIPFEDAANMEPGEWAQVAQVAGVKKVTPSMQVQALSKLKSLQASTAESFGKTVGGASGLEDALQSHADAAIQRIRDRGTFEGTKLNAAVPVDDLGDMAIWGAAKIAKGVTKFAPWAKEMLAEIGPAVEPKLKELYDNSQKIYGRHVENTANALPNTKEVLRMYREGQAGEDWYKNTHQELQSVFGPDTGKVVDFLAATSPNTTVASNVTLALKAYQQWKNGQPFTGYLPETVKSLNKAAAGEDFGGSKVASFRANLQGDPVPVTVDRWIARAYGFRKPSITDPQYKFIDYAITQVAKDRGIEPRQLQAAIWKTIKEAEGSASNTSDAFEAVVRRKIAADPALEKAISQALAAHPD